MITALSGNKRKQRRLGGLTELIQDFVTERRSRPATEVHRELTKKCGGSEVASVRTVRDIIKEAHARDPTEPWALADAEPDEVAALAPVWSFAEVYGRHFSKRMAEWALRILAAAPDIAPMDAYRLSGIYAVSDGPVPWIDSLLAFRPWASDESRERYCEAANGGRIPAPASAFPIATRRPKSELGPHAAALQARWGKDWRAVIDWVEFIKGDSIIYDREPRSLSGEKVERKPKTRKKVRRGK